MGHTIQRINADNEGNGLFIKNLTAKRHEKKNYTRLYIEYRCTHNDYPFLPTEIFLLPDDNVVINGDDGTVLYRFHINHLKKIDDDNILNMR